VFEEKLNNKKNSRLASFYVASFYLCIRITLGGDFELFL
jgi:hypothetical protein